MSLKSNMPKWLFLSTMKHFTDNIAGLHVFAEGTERNTKSQSSWAEIRIDGPDISEISKDTYRVEAEINILVATHIDPSNPMLSAQNVGKVTANFIDYDLYEYTDGDAKIGCFKLTPLANIGDKLDITNMGQIDPNLDLLQTTIVGNYRIII